MPGVRLSFSRAVVILALLGGGRQLQAGFRLVDLGPSSSNQTGGATGINSDGAVTGFISGGGKPQQAAYAPAGGHLQAIDTTQLPGVSGSVASAINGNNIAGTFYDSTDGHYHALLATGGTATDFGTFASGMFKGADTTGVGVSGSGELIGTAHLTSGASVAFRESSAGKASVITSPTGSTSAQAAGVNDSGTAVGSYTNAQGASRVFIAAQNTAVDLLSQFGTAGFGSNTSAAAINNQGMVTGYGDFGGQDHSFLTSVDSKTGVKSLIDLGFGAGFSSTVSIALNNQGQVVGKMNNQGSNSRAFLWDQSIGVTDLNSLLASTDQAHWSLTVATGINDSGMIAGQGYLDGQLHGFLLAPVPGSFAFFPAPSVVPTPPSVWMALGSLAMTGGWLRIRRGRTAGRDAA